MIMLFQQFHPCPHHLTVPSLQILLKRQRDQGCMWMLSIIVRVHLVLQTEAIAGTA